MSKSRTFVAKILGMEAGMHRAESVRFADVDDEFHLNESDDIEAEDEIPEHDLTDPFACLKFVEEQVRKRHYVAAVLDYEVTMTVLTTNRDLSLEQDQVVVRPWTDPKNAAIFNAIQ